MKRIINWKKCNNKLEPFLIQIKYKIYKKLYKYNNKKQLIFTKTKKYLKNKIKINYNML